MKYGIRHKLSGEIWNKTSSKAQPWFERPAKYGGLDWMPALTWNRYCAGKRALILGSLPKGFIFQHSLNFKSGLLRLIKFANHHLAIKSDKDWWYEKKTNNDEKMSGWSPIRCSGLGGRIVLLEKYRRV